MIVAANHASSADPVLIGAFLNAAIDRPLNWLGKRELTEFGRSPAGRSGAPASTRWIATRPISRSFRTAMRILDAGQLLAVFPEGTRSRDGGLQRVREGVGMLALRSGAPVLPVAVVDSDLMWPRGPPPAAVREERHGSLRERLHASAKMLASRGEPIKGREATEAATRLIMEPDRRAAPAAPARRLRAHDAEAESRD